MTQEVQPVLSVIIATYNNRAILERCLAQWEQHANGQPVEIIVIADGCQDDTEAFLAKRQEMPWGQRHLRWVVENNVHELRCTNRGLAEARGSLVLSWHDDMFLQHAGMVPELIATFAAYKDIGLISLSRGLLCHPAQRPHTWDDLCDWNRIESTIGRRPWNWMYLTEVDAVMRPWVVRRECIQRVGALDEAFKLTEWDEADLCFRIREAGWKVATHGYERLGYYHHLGSSTLGRTMTDSYRAQAVRNGQLFYDLWSDMIARDAQRKRQTWPRRLSPLTWTRTLQRALCYRLLRRESHFNASSVQ